MLQWKAPYWECLEFGIAGMYSTFVFPIQLAEAYCHLATAWTRCGDNHQWSLGLHKFILAKAFVGRYEGYVVWIAVYEIVDVCLDAHTLKP